MSGFPFELNHPYVIKDQEIIVNCPTVAAAGVYITAYDRVGSFYSQIDPTVKKVRLQVNGRDLYPTFPAVNLPIIDTQNLRSLEMSDRHEILLCEARESSKPIGIADYHNHIGRFFNHRFSPEQLLSSPQSFVGANLLDCWRDSKAELHDLQELLRQTQKANNFSFHLRRIDGSLIRVVADFILLPDFPTGAARMNTQQEWECVEAAT